VLVIVARSSFVTIAAIICGFACARGQAQEFWEAPAADPSTTWTADSANLDGCQVIARIDNQIVLACEVLWRVNQTLEEHQQRVPAEQRIPPEQLPLVREQLMRRELAAMLDRKLLFGEFRRNVPAENLPRIEESLREPFEDREMPELFAQLKVNNQADLERELARLGSSLSDVRRTFNEKVIASEWIRSKVKVNEEVSPEEMVEYYRAHLTDYDYPTQARWEELMVRRGRFADSQQAYAALARMGNEVWEMGTQKQVQGAAFAEVAKAKSDGFTAKEGGVHDWTTQGALKSAAIDQALFSLEVGQMSPILESEEGFHIVRVLERKQAGRRPFTEVQAEIRERLREERFHAGVKEYLGQLRRDARIWTAYTGNVSADVLLGRKPEDTLQR
jgi:parvulin-like peptidyl-prolyl isomerase